MTTFEEWSSSEERRRANAATRLGAPLAACLCLTTINRDHGFHIGPSSKSGQHVWVGPVCCSLACARKALEVSPPSPDPHYTLFVWRWDANHSEQLAYASWRRTRKRPWRLTPVGSAHAEWEREMSKKARL